MNEIMKAEGNGSGFHIYNLDGKYKHFIFALEGETYDFSTPEYKDSEVWLCDKPYKGSDGYSTPYKVRSRIKIIESWQDPTKSTFSWVKFKLL